MTKDEYIAQLTDIEKIAYATALKMFGPMYDITKTNGFKKKNIPPA